MIEAFQASDSGSNPGGSTMVSAQAGELRAMLRDVKAQPPAASIAQFRARIEALTAPFHALVPGTKRTAVEAGGVPAVWLDPPASRPDRAMLYLHGGTYVGGSRPSPGGPPPPP